MVSPIDPTKRGLKDSKKYQSDLGAYLVSPIDPTKRGLKENVIFRTMYDSMCFTHRPDEKGTESLETGSGGKMWKVVSPIDPTKRGLKDNTGDFNIWSKYQFHPSTRRKGD